MRAEIISVGTELLLGDILNTNARYLAQQLAALGYTVYYQTVVGDNSVRLRSLIQTAKDRSDVLIFTGGLGPTDDDMTKETVAAMFGDSLVMDEEELTNLKNFFVSLGRPMAENNIKQAMVPKNGRKLPNSNGTAPGAFFRQGNKYAFLLPGPPQEMELMFTQQVQPVLEAMQDSSIRSLVLRVFGIGESDLENKVKTLLDGENPTAALYAKTGEVHIRITASASTANQADLMCAEYADMFRTLLGDVIYSDNGDNLETTLVKQLTHHGEMLATAESCTGGLLSERITSVADASAVFGFGVVTYANEVKRELLGVRAKTLRHHGAVSSQVAAEMAWGAAKRGLAEYGVGITGLAGPGGASEDKPVGLVYVAAASGGQVWIKKLQIFGRTRAYVRELATQHALDMVRRLADGLPIPGAKSFTKGEDPEFDRVTRPKRWGDSLVRGALSLLAVAVVFGGLALGINAIQNRPTPTQDNPFPSATGLRYGTPEYTAAAHTLVAEKQSHTPSITGFVATADGTLEQMVTQVAAKQDALMSVTHQPGTEGLALLGGDVRIGAPVSHTLLLGDTTFAPIDAYTRPEGCSALSTFTYFTAKESKVYRVFAVYTLDDADEYWGDFTPLALELTQYENFLAFTLGTKARSLYEISVDFTESDSFMTLATPQPGQPGRTVYLCGRLQRPGEQTLEPPVLLPAGQPVMPAGYYTQQELPQPDIAAVQARWLAWYTSRGTTNQSLQLAAGMPETDKAPPGMPSLVPLPDMPAPSSPIDESEQAAIPLSARLASASTEAPSSSQAESSSPSSGDSSGESASSESSSSSASEAQSEAPPPEPVPLQDPHFLTVTLNGSIVTDSTLNILAQICQVEALTTHPAAIQAQAIATHSWILNQQGAGNIAPAVLGAPPSTEVLAAVGAVVNVVLSADGEAPAFTPSFRTGATGTNTPQNIWGFTRSYLPSVPTPHDQIRHDWRSTHTLTTTEVADILRQTISIDFEAESFSDTGLPLLPEKWFAKPQYAENGYVSTIDIGTQSFTGYQFWQQVLLRQGAPVLSSPAFEIAYDGAQFIFTSQGSGHGCGLSQTGAAAYARDGWSYSQILQYYFPGINLMTWG